MESASRETIEVGALSVRFLVEAADSNGTVSVFECFVPAQSKMPAPHSHDAFEETIYGLEASRLGRSTAARSISHRARRSVCRGVPSTDLTPRRRGRQVPRDRQPGPHEPGLLSRRARGARRECRRPARPRQGRGGHATVRPHSRFTLRRVKERGRIGAVVATDRDPEVSHDG